MKYFTDNQEYPNFLTDEILPWGTLWTYVSSTFANGFLNYAKPLDAWVLERYQPWDTRFEDDEFPFDGPITIEGKVYHTKAEIYNVYSLGADFHTQLGHFRDDVLLLSKIEAGKYIFFWLDCDVSDCSVGRFETDDPESTVIEEFRKDVQRVQKITRSEGNSRPLPTKAIKGWVKF